MDQKRLKNTVVIFVERIFAQKGDREMFVKLIIQEEEAKVLVRGLSHPGQHLIPRFQVRGSSLNNVRQ